MLVDKQFPSAVYLDTKDGRVKATLDTITTESIKCPCCNNDINGIYTSSNIYNMEKEKMSVSRYTVCVCGVCHKKFKSDILDSIQEDAINHFVKNCKNN